MKSIGGVKWMLKHCTGIFEIQFSFHKKSVLKKNDETIYLFFKIFGKKLNFTKNVVVVV
jgi:hypothetical protein